MSKLISIRNKAVVLQSANTARKYLPTACTTYSINNPNADRQELAVSDLIEKYRYIEKSSFLLAKRMMVNSYSYYVNGVNHKT